MGAKSAPTSPSVEPNDEGHFTTPTGVCCWCEDYEKEIDVNAVGRYYRRFHNSAQARGSAPRWFKLTAALRTGRIKVEIRYSFRHYPPTTPAQLASAIGGLISGARSWNGKIAIEIDDPECGKRVLPVEFDAVQVTSGQHYKVLLFEAIPEQYGVDRAHVQGDEMRVLVSTGEWVYSHEHAHCFGLPDEYGYSDVEVEQVVYIRPDGSNDPPIDVDTLGVAGRGPAVNIMSTHAQERRWMRHGYGIAIEVQALLTQRLGRTIRCKVVRPPE
ncbi:MAG TPA: hypothetical protein VE093_14930 [Polyangiaceae bacterium]|jgi:type VI secretion system secreted protein VgrG|nr:hypothetical protein [Polyangiaceae bacterium]